MTIQAVGDKVLLRRDPVTVTAGGVLLKDTDQNRPPYGSVVSAGEQAYLCKMAEPGKTIANPPLRSVWVAFGHGTLVHSGEVLGVFADEASAREIHAGMDIEEWDVSGNPPLLQAGQRVLYNQMAVIEELTGDAAPFGLDGDVSDYAFIRACDVLSVVAA